jgi:hypothetical protein
MAALGMEQATTIDFMKARARARAVATSINHEGTPHLTFACALHRWGQQGVPVAEGHPWRSHRATVREFTPAVGQGFCLECGLFKGKLVKDCNRAPRNGNYIFTDVGTIPSSAGPPERMPRAFSMP